MAVWIVTAGCEYDGAEIKGVLGEADDALACVEDWLGKQRSHFVEDEEASEPDGARIWRNGSDFICMEPWVVR